MFVDEWLRRLRYFWRRREETDALSEEMQLHRELLAQKMAGETSDEKALRAARIRFGNATQLQEQALSVWTWSWLGSLVKDIRYTLRSLAASPVFTAVVVLTLAGGIGANTAIFSVANAVLLRALPVRDAARTFYLHVMPGQPDGISNTGNSVSSFGYSVFTELRKQTRAFAAVAAYVPLSYGKTPVRTGELPREASVHMVSGDFFAGLGVPVLCGAGISRDDENKSAHVAVINAAFAAQNFGEPCSSLGKTLFIKGMPFAIAGVASARFSGAEATATDAWIPLGRKPIFNAWGSSGNTYEQAADWWCLRLMVRLAPRLTEKQALAQAMPAFLKAAYEPLGGKPHPGEEPRRLELLPAQGQPDAAADFRRPMQILFAMVAAILCIACGNVAMLLIGRNLSRQREFSIRLALGGSKARLFQQLLVESLLLVSGGALAGWIFALIATRVLARWAQMEMSLSPDSTVLFFTLALSLAVGLLFGLAPLRTALEGGSEFALKESAATAGVSRWKAATRRSVLALQVAIGLALTVSAGLLTGTLRNLQTLDIGFSADRLLVFGIDPPLADGAASQPLLNSLRELPGVQAVTTVENRPGSGWSNNHDAGIDGQNPRQTLGVASTMVRWNAVGPDYFNTVGIPLRAGRLLNESDSPNAAKVAVVNETFVRKFFPRRLAVGHQLSLSKRMVYTIVGVVRNNKYTGLREEETPMAYMNIGQVPEMVTGNVILRTTSGDPMKLLPAVRKRLATFSPDATPLQPMTLQAQFGDTIASERLIARLALFFGALALLLVATGLYGTLAYSVNRRTAELGIRMAIGAQRPTLLWMVMRENLIVCAAGLLIGLPLSFYAGNLLASQLFGLSAHNGPITASACCVLLFVTIAASAIPGYRAASVDPIRALRYE